MKFLFLGLVMFAAQANASIDGVWTLNFDWGCTGQPYQAIWTIHTDGTFNDDQDNAGIWTHDASTAAVNLDYGTGLAKYIGTVTTYETQMSGDMIWDGNVEGCWTATRASGVQRFTPAPVSTARPN